MGAIEVVTKVCPACGEEKPASGFHKNKSRKDGLSYECAECRGQRQIEHREKYIAEHGEDAWREYQSSSSKKYRSTERGRAAARRHSANRNLAVKHLINNHPEEFERLKLLAKRGELPELKGRDGNGN